MAASITNLIVQTSADVAIVGGGFAGAISGILLKRRRPQTKVVILEKSPAFDRKVGESTAEISAAFLTRVLGLNEWLGHEQLPKQGLRMWFANDPRQPFADCVELGARYQVRLPAYQVDRQKLDEHLLDLARKAGCHVLRPARVSGIEPGKNGGWIEAGEEKLRAHWIIDASGRTSVLPRKLGHFKKLDAHPISAIWARFTGVREIDGYELRRENACFGRACRTTRAFATNHLMGDGWWCWIIPLRGGDFSAGLVYDERLFQPPRNGSPGERLKAHLLTHPVGRLLFSEAEIVPNDTRAYSYMPYYSEKIAGKGWFAVGDAAGFMDPLYSPGLDFCCYTSSIAARMIAEALDGKDMESELCELNDQFTISFNAWFGALYRDKYYYLGDAELMSAALLLDVATYFLGPLRLIYEDPEKEFQKLPFNGAGGKTAARLMVFYNRRFARLAQRRRQLGCFGINNGGWRELYDGFSPDGRAAKLLMKSLLRWWRLEIADLFLRKKKMSADAGSGELFADKPEMPVERAEAADFRG